MKKSKKGQLGMNFKFPASKTIYEDKDFYRSKYRKQYTNGEVSEGLNKGYEMITSQANGLDIGVDSTDHFWFVCNHCGKRMTVVSAYSMSTPGIRLDCFCEQCGFSGGRKIYFSKEDNVWIGKNQEWSGRSTYKKPFERSGD